MKKIVTKFLQFQSQMRILHWQTTSYAEHMAFGSIYDAADDIIDRIVEVTQGKYGRITLGGLESIIISDYSSLKLNMFLMDIETFVCVEIYQCGIDKEKDSEIENLLQEFRAEVDKLKYLLTLK